MCDTASEISRNATNSGFPATSATTSANTIRSALRQQGLVAKLKARKPALTNLHMRLRLDWARQHRHWTVGGWEKVIFSDEPSCSASTRAAERGAGDPPVTTP